jgi:aryl-alcohol dehydrogenase-like predicted oxidoreductase
MHDLRRAGKVRYVGFTAWRAHKQELGVLLESGLFDTLQTEYNLLNQTAQGPPPPGTDIMDDTEMEAVDEAQPLSFRYRRVDQGLTIAKAAARRMGVICIRPYLAGVLTDALDRPVEPGPMEQLVRYGRTLEFLKQPGVRTLSQAALIFCLMNPQISTVVPGAKNTAEIVEAAACSGAPRLNDDEVRRIMELYRSNYAAS